jgi:hypothetical protein
MKPCEHSVWPVRAIPLALVSYLHNPMLTLVFTLTVHHSGTNEDGMLSPYAHQLNGAGTACADDCPACKWATRLPIMDLNESAPVATHEHADFEVHNEGSVYLLQPLTPAAAQWIAEHLPEDRTTFGTAVVIEHRFIGPIVEAIRADGLEVL